MWSFLTVFGGYALIVVGVLMPDHAEMDRAAIIIVILGVGSVLAGNVTAATSILRREIRGENDE